MRNLIEREKALDALDFTRIECYKAVFAIPRDPYLSGYVAGVARAWEIVRDLGGITRRCATCEHWVEYGETPSHTDGECCSQAYLHGDEPVFTKPDHFCAAWKARDNA